jgi:hypothetical protein
MQPISISDQQAPDVTRPREMEWNDSSNNPLISSSEQKYRNPWTSVSRPMNRFMDVDESEWQKAEDRKQQLAKDLMQQIEERRRKKEEEERRREQEEIRMEQKIK